jgi:hypothetical protein
MFFRYPSPGFQPGVGYVERVLLMNHFNGLPQVKFPVFQIEHHKKKGNTKRHFLFIKSENRTRFCPIQILSDRSL